MLEIITLYTKEGDTCPIQATLVFIGLIPEEGAYGVAYDSEGNFILDNLGRFKAVNTIKES